jgi:hypothetical protein
MLFPDLPMGSEAYYIYIDAQNREISADNPESFNGRRIGVNDLYLPGKKVTTVHRSSLHLPDNR